MVFPGVVPSVCPCSHCRFPWWQGGVTTVAATTGRGGPGFPRWNSGFPLNRFYRVHCTIWSGGFYGEKELHGNLCVWVDGIQCSSNKLRMNLWNILLNEIRWSNPLLNAPSTLLPCSFFNWICITTHTYIIIYRNAWRWHYHMHWSFFFFWQLFISLLVFFWLSFLLPLFSSYPNFTQTTPHIPRGPKMTTLYVSSCVFLYAYMIIEKYMVHIYSYMCSFNHT